MTGEEETSTAERGEADEADRAEYSAAAQAPILAQSGTSSESSLTNWLLCRLCSK